MSIALNTTGSGADHHHRTMACAATSSIYNYAEFVGDCQLPLLDQMPPESQNGSLTSSSSSSTSSIGKNSDESGSGGGDGGEEEEEVQSECKGGALDSLDALEEVLPVKKSISRYYCGKSKSFTSLSDAASCSSIKDITKPENEYTRKRKNLLAFNNFLDRHQQSRSNSGSISKRHTNSRSMLSLVGSSVNNNSSTSNLLAPSYCLPPLPPLAKRSMRYEPPVFPPAAKFSSLRSFSLSDFQGAAEVDASSSNVLQNIQK